MGIMMARAVLVTSGLASRTRTCSTTAFAGFERACTAHSYEPYCSTGKSRLWLDTDPVERTFKGRAGDDFVGRLREGIVWCRSQDRVTGDPTCV